MPAVAPAPVAAVALAVAAVVLVALSVATARPPAAPVVDREGYFARWAALHGGYDPATGSVWVRGWLGVAHVLARPLARAGVLPDALTAWTVWLTAAVVVCAAAGGRWPLLGAAVVVASGLADNLDGAVAVLTDRATTWGYVLDSVVDRLNDVLYLVALVLLGAPLELAAACGAALYTLEYARARAAGAGGPVLGTVTVGERPNRVLFTALALAAGGAVPARAALLATGSLAALTALTAVGLVQLAVALRRALR